jgi:transcriptional regulator GlxA family with amidase domain
VTARRLERARVLLEAYPAATVRRIGDAVGFRNASAFGRAFRRRFGHAPGCYRRPPSRAEAATIPARGCK